MQAKTLKTILAREYGAKFKNAVLLNSFLGSDGNWHGGPYAMGGCTRQKAPGSQSGSFEEISKGVFCKSCLGLSWYNDAFDSAAGFKLVREYYELETKVKSLTKLNGVSASAVQKRIKDASNVKMRISQGKSKTPKDGKLWEAYDALLPLLEDAEKILKAHGKGDKARKDLERRVQQQLVPAAYRSQSFELDNTMMLIGISPGNAIGRGIGTKTDIVKAVIEAYSIRSDDKAVVLHAPAYFYTFLLGMLYFKSRQETLIVSTRAPESPEARDNAAQLWDPQNESVLACLSRATETGNALSG